MQSSSPSCNTENKLNWHAVYTRSRFEQKVASQFGQKGIDSYFPLRQSTKRWNNGQLAGSTALFPGYVFARFASEDRMRVIQTSGVVRVVGFGKTMESVPDEDILKLRIALASGAFVQLHPYLRTGDRVRIVRGPLRDVEGILVREKRGSLLVLSVDLIARSVSI